MSAPRLGAEQKLWLSSARHPLLLHLFRHQAAEGDAKEVVPVDVRLGYEYDLLVITGPNTGGKTVALK
ncbi:MAG TPA: DNA strand exchange inhibitor protein, partial [Gemmatales bacterium]|nr:DNA strand exchange inhibitor protein [Gemmatales bacterium]